MFPGVRPPGTRARRFSGPGLKRPGYRPVLSEAEVWIALTRAGIQSSDRSVRQKGLFPADGFN
ncbi:hypothetical protein QA601_00480 [Chitinispirillales bacterium ANBcel5]|uniref:hypothetical protein n=1 Tax=Cellulosispirillum alkaliphilum TaxID=3039283 RepID=UPI002A582841|nr:hypothetical protein [Chitinispirillales bacterium ANBcel5]